MTATEELLPCPICGRQPDFQHFNITPNVQGRIVCSCGIELRQGKNDTEDDMRIIWNTRSDYAVQAENERKTAQAIAATLGDADLAAENAKLRELVRDMWACVSHIGEYDAFYYDMAKDGCGISCTVNGEHCCADKLYDRMRELGLVGE